MKTFGIILMIISLLNYIIKLKKEEISILSLSTFIYLLLIIKWGDEEMILLKTIFYLFLILLVALDVVLILLIYHLINYKMYLIAVRLEEEESEEYFEKARKIIRKEGTD